MMDIEYIQIPNAPAPVGHYSPAVIHNGLIFVSGQLPINPQTEEKITGSIEAQTRQVLVNISEILKAAGSDLSRVLKMTVYVSDISLWGAVNEVYGEVMGEARPARAVVPTKELHYGFLIEIDAIAAVLKP